MTKSAEKSQRARPFQIYPAPDLLETPRVDIAPRIYRAPWRGELVLACGKCQKKIRKHSGSKAIAKVSRWFKRRTKGAPEAHQVRVLNIPCVKMCPKAGVTVFNGRHLARRPAGVCILRSQQDLEGFYRTLVDP